MTTTVKLDHSRHTTHFEVSSADFAHHILDRENGRRVYVSSDGKNGADAGLFPSEALALAQALIEHAGYDVKLSIPSPEATPATLHGEDDEDDRAGWNTDALFAAIEYERTAEFSYEKAGSVIERRVLKPESINTTRAGKLVVVGEDQQRDETRVFRLDRIVGYVTVR